MIGATLLAPRAQGGWATHSPDDDYWYGPRGDPTVSGVAVDEELAMSYAAIYACVNKRSKTIATLPFHVYREADGRKEKIQDHPVRRWFTVRPNSEALAVPTRWAMNANLDLWGNAYFEILLNSAGEPIGLELLYSRYMRVTRDRDTREIVYEYSEPGVPSVPLERDRVLHIVGMGYNGLVGRSVIGMLRETAGIGIATTDFRAGFLGNGAAPGIVIERPPDTAKTLSVEAGERLLRTFNEKHQGARRSFRTALLRDGMTLKTIGMPMVDAQYVELAQHDRESWCGIFDTPPAMIHDLTHGTFSNVEQQGIFWATGSLTPPCVLIENALNATFFDGTALYAKHNLDGLQRGDILKRHQAYRIGREIGLYNTNDLRDKEEMNPTDHGDDDWLRPKNMAVVGEEPDEAIATSTELPNETEGAGAIAAVNAKAECLGELVEEVGQRHARHAKVTADEQVEQYQKLAHELMLISNGVAQLSDDAEKARLADLCSLMTDPATRIVTKETKAVAAAWKRAAKESTAKSFSAWLDKFYTAQQPNICEVFLATVSFTAGQLGVATARAIEVLGEFATAEAEISLAALREGSVSSRSSDAVLAELEQWTEEKPASMVRRLITRLCEEQTTDPKRKG